MPKLAATLRPLHPKRHCMRSKANQCHPQEIAALWATRPLKLHSRSRAIPMKNSTGIDCARNSAKESISSALITALYVIAERAREGDDWHLNRRSRLRGCFCCAWCLHFCRGVGCEACLLSLCPPFIDVKGWHLNWRSRLRGCLCCAWRLHFGSRHRLRGSFSAFVCTFY